MKRLILVTLALTAMGSAPAWATCPPLSAYQVSGVSSHTHLTQAVNRLFAGTAWTVQTAALGKQVPVQLDHVSGPLSQVLQHVVLATADTPYLVHTVADAATCTLHVAVFRHPRPTVAVALPKLAFAPTAAPAVTAPALAPVKPVPVPPAKPYTLPAGSVLSQALTQFVQAREWRLEWTLPTDYTLPASVTIPSADAGNVIRGVEYVFRAYRARGALTHATLIFARGNHVVAVVPTTAAQGAH